MNHDVYRNVLLLKQSRLVFTVPHHHQMSLPSSRGTSKMLSDIWTIHLDTICDGGKERHFNHAAKQHSFSYISIIIQVSSVMNVLENNSRLRMMGDLMLMING